MYDFKVEFLTLDIKNTIQRDEINKFDHVKI